MEESDGTGTQAPEDRLKAVNDVDHSTTNGETLSPGKLMHPVEQILVTMSFLM